MASTPFSVILNDTFANAVLLLGFFDETSVFFRKSGGAKLGDEGKNGKKTPFISKRYDCFWLDF